jgi:hypothetical protein
MTGEAPTRSEVTSFLFMIRSPSLLHSASSPLVEALPTRCILVLPIVLRFLDTHLRSKGDPGKFIQTSKRER